MQFLHSRTEGVTKLPELRSERIIQKLRRSLQASGGGDPIAIATSDYEDSVPPRRPSSVALDRRSRSTSHPRIAGHLARGHWRGQ